MLTLVLLQARCTRDASEIHPRCTRDAPEMHPRCARETPCIRGECPTRTIPSTWQRRWTSVHVAGEAAEKREVDAIANSMKEARATQSYRSFELLASVVSFAPHVNLLVLPLHQAPLLTKIIIILLTCPKAHSRTAHHLTSDHHYSMAPPPDPASPGTAHHLTTS